ncbi:HDOD domain-containing protein [Neptunomonas marina]|uniref:HDOD domain-containing protein n=2 Tax=Neptunomonas marina TaxID=1815562 RepID=A0A437QC67_9GAMM|nr:HDOD domain-containing protein [Neptunomonas marina]
MLWGAASVFLLVEDLTMESPLLLIFEPNEEVRSAFQAAMAEITDSQWRVYEADSLDSALQALRDSAPNVVVSHSFTTYGGAEFLALAKQLQPEAVRVLFTEDFHDEVMTDSIAAVHLVMPQPLSCETLADIVTRAQTMQRLKLNDSLRSSLGRIDALPLLPSSYLQLCRVLDDPDASLSQVARLVEQDPALLAKVLHIANSAFFGFSSPVDSAFDAALRLGIDLLKSLVLVLGVYAGRRGLSAADQQRLANNAFLVADRAAELSRYLGRDRKQTERAYIAGLLHNVGEILGGILEVQDSRSTADEFDLSQGDYSVAGGYLLSLWGFPAAVVDAVCFSNQPQNMPQPNELCTILYVAQLAVSCQQNQVDPLLSLDKPLVAAHGIDVQIVAWLKDARP